MRFHFGILVLSSLTFSLSYGQNQAKTYHEQMAQVERIKVVGFKGSVKMVSQPAATQAVVKIGKRKPGADDWRESIRREGTTLVVEVQAPAGRALASAQEQKSWPQYDIEVTARDVPSEIFWHSGETHVQSWKAPITVTQQSGKLTVNGGEGESKLSLQEGKLTLTDRRGRATLDAFNAELLVKNVDGDTVIENYNGKSQLSDLSGQMQLRAGSGHVQMAHCQGGLEFRLEKGILNVTGFTGPVRGTSEQASINLQVEEPVDVRLKAQEGKLVVAVPPGIGASVNIETKEGELILPKTINVKRGNEDRVALGDLPGTGRGYIHIRTDSASVRLK